MASDHGRPQGGGAAPRPPRGGGPCAYAQCQLRGAINALFRPRRRLPAAVAAGIPGHQRVAFAANPFAALDKRRSPRSRCRCWSRRVAGRRGHHHRKSRSIGRGCRPHMHAVLTADRRLPPPSRRRRRRPTEPVPPSAPPPAAEVAQQAAQEMEALTSTLASLYGTDGATAAPPLSPGFGAPPAAPPPSLPLPPPPPPPPPPSPPEPFPPSPPVPSPPPPRPRSSLLCPGNWEMQSRTSSAPPFPLPRHLLPHRPSTPPHPSRPSRPRSRRRPLRPRRRRWRSKRRWRWAR